MNKESICILVPCYNEQQRLPVDRFVSYIEAYQHIDFCFVNDGSKDDTISVLQGIKEGRESRVMVLDLQPNVGKAEAVRQGMLEASKWKNFSYIGYFDADLATPLEEINFFYDFNQGELTHAIVMGSRIQRLGAHIERYAYRHYFGRVFSTFASLVLDLSVYDTQCGAKLIRTDLIPYVFDRPFLSRWLFDIEMIARAKYHFGPEEVKNHIQEIPLRTWVEVGESKIQLKDMFRLPKELWKIHRMYRKGYTAISQTNDSTISGALSLSPDSVS